MFSTICLYLFSSSGKCLSAPIVDSLGYIYITTANGILQKIQDNTTSASLILSMNTSSLITSSLALDNKGILYFGSQNNNLYCFKED
jgi:outer membrane protein assembly factor BamB